MVVNFRVNHAPPVLTGETREMQENGTPAKCSLYIFFLSHSWPLSICWVVFLCPFPGGEI